MRTKNVTSNRPYQRYKYFIFFISLLTVFQFNIVLSSTTNPLFKDLSSGEISKIFGEIDPQVRIKRLTPLYDTADSYNKYIILPKLSKTAIKVNDITLAEKYAKELLSLSEQYRGDWNYGNSIHDANIVLGMVALKTGDVNGAGVFLLKAGKAPTSPQLETFGPNTMLAKALLEKGEKKIVLAYFELLKNIWLENEGRLDSWISAIKGGGMPFFDYNLYI